MISFVVDISFTFYYNLVGISFSGMMLGAFFGLFFARLGWSKSRVVDLLFNRLSIILIIASQIISTIQISVLGNTLEETNYTIIMLFVGIALVLLGMRFHSPTGEHSRIERERR